MPVAVLEISHAHRDFTDRQALIDVSLSINAGEIVALLGPNGAGKTTLMRAATGRINLSSGSVSVMGADPRQNRRARESLGVVPQTIALYGQLTARQNLDILARLSGLKGASVAAAVDQALVRAGLEDRSDELLTALSGGMQRRLNIVAGALHQPKLLLLDEPTVGVDMQSCESVHAMLRTLRDSGIAVLFSTHDFDQAAAVADRVAFMVNGRIILEGPVKELIENEFGDAKEAVIALAEPATAEVMQVLEACALQVSPDGRTWSALLAGGYGELAKLEKQLQESGALVTELRVREPGLASVFMRRTAKEAEK